MRTRRQNAPISVLIGLTVCVLCYHARAQVPARGVLTVRVVVRARLKDEPAPCVVVQEIPVDGVAVAERLRNVYYPIIKPEMATDSAD